MPSIVKVYTDSVYENLKPMRANWQPLSPIELGTVGKLDGEIFRPSGDLKRDFGIDYGQAVKGPNVTHIYFTTTGNSSVSINAAGSLPQANAKANIQISFSSSEGVFFNGAGCVYHSIADKLGLGRQIMQFHQARKWDTDLLVVVDFIEVAETTLAVSGAETSNITFEASANVPSINLSDASLGLTLKSSNNIGYQLASSQALRPLISLAKVQTPWFGPDTWGPAFSLGVAMGGGRDITQDRIFADRKSDSEEKYFGTFY